MADDSENDVVENPSGPAPGDDSSEQAIPTQPEETGADRMAAGGRYLVDQVLSIPQYMKLLMDKSGMYDMIYNKGPAAAVQDATAEPQATPYGQLRTPNLINTGVGESPVPGQEAPVQIGSPEEQEPTYSGVPMPQPRPANAPTPPVQMTGQPTGRNPGSNVGLPQYNRPPPPPPETDYEKQVRVFGKDAVDAAQQLYPMVGQHDQRAAFLRGVFESNQKEQAATGRTQITAETRMSVAEIAAEAARDKANINALASNERGRMALQGVLYKADSLFAGQREKEYMATLRAKINMGQRLDDTEAGVVQIIAKKVKEQEDAAQAQQQTQGTPLAGAGATVSGKKPPPGWVKTSPVRGDQVNTQ